MTFVAIPEHPDWSVFDIFDWEASRYCRVSVSELPDEVIEDSFYGIECGPDDLCLIHFPLSPDIGLFEFVNQIVAHHFELPSRVFSICYGEGFKGCFYDLERGVDATGLNLSPKSLFRCHSVVPRSLWTCWKADHAASVASREEPLQPLPKDTGRKVA